MARLPPLGSSLAVGAGRGYTQPILSFFSCLYYAALLQRYNLISFISGQPEEQESIFRHQSGEGIRRLHLCAHPAAPRRDKLHWIKLAIRMLQVCGDLLNFCYMHSTMIMHLSDLLNTRKIPLHFNVMILLTSISNHTSTRSLGHFKPHIP